MIRSINVIKNYRKYIRLKSEAVARSMRERIPRGALWFRLDIALSTKTIMYALLLVIRCFYRI